MSTLAQASIITSTKSESSKPNIKQKKQLSSSPNPQNERGKKNTKDLKEQIFSQYITWLNKLLYFLKTCHKPTFP